MLYFNSVSEHTQDNLRGKNSKSVSSTLLVKVHTLKRLQRGPAGNREICTNRTKGETCASPSVAPLPFRQSSAKHCVKVLNIFSLPASTSEEQFLKETDALSTARLRGENMEKRS